MSISNMNLNWFYCFASQYYTNELDVQSVAILIKNNSVLYSYMTANKHCHHTKSKVLMIYHWFAKPMYEKNIPYYVSYTFFHFGICTWL